MNYELKSVSPASVFINTIRIFVLVGFIAAIYSFFFSPYGGVRLGGFGQKILATLLFTLVKILATLLFTLVYALVVSGILTFIAWLYNFWAASYKGITFHFEQEQ